VYETRVCSDVGCLQVGSDLEASVESEARHDAVVHIKATQDADQVSGTTVAQEQHEDHVGNLPESTSSVDR